MFSISEIALNSDALKEQLKNPKAGALVVFEGWVRNHNEGHQVASIEYEAYQDLAHNEALKILQETKNKFNIFDIQCVHRVGHLLIGDIAVWIGATAAHRAQAFSACQYAIDEIKKRLPIWKKEHYLHREAQWVNCQECLHISKKTYLSRQLSLIGDEGQKRIEKASVLIVGAGGLGSAALTYLGSSGLGRLGICDFDQIELSNLHRQPLFDISQIGRLKAEVAKENLLKKNPWIEIEVFPFKLNHENGEDILKNFDMIIDCTDNFKTKFLIHELSHQLKIPLIQSSLYQYEGHIQAFTHQKGTPCFRCLWPEIPEEGCVGSCAEVGILGAVAGVFGSLQAMEALKMILGKPITTDTLIFDLLTLQTTRITALPNPLCPLCFPNNKNTFSLKNRETNFWELDENVLNQIQDYTLIDLRDNIEKEDSPYSFDQMMHLPLSENESLENYRKLSHHKKYLFICSHGVRSRKVTSQLQNEGFDHFFSFLPGAKGLRNFRILS